MCDRNIVLSDSAIRSHKKIVMIEISKLQFDDNNPNKMNEAQLDALKKNLLDERIGMDEPIIVQQNELNEKSGKIAVPNTWKIANGEHRAIAMKSLGETKIPAIVYDMTEKTRIKIRQTHNKLHGEHDPLLDAEEFLRIQEMGAQEEFQDALAMSDLEFQKIAGGKDNDIPVDNTHVDIPNFVEHKCVVPECSHGSNKEEEEEE